MVLVRTAKLAAGPHSDPATPFGGAEPLPLRVLQGGEVSGSERFDACAEPEAAATPAPLKLRIGGLGVAAVSPEPAHTADPGDGFGAAMSAGGAPLLPIPSAGGEGEGEATRLSTVPSASAPVLSKLAPLSSLSAKPWSDTLEKPASVATTEHREGFFRRYQAALVFVAVLLVMLGDICRRNQWGPFAPKAEPEVVDARPAEQSAGSSPGAIVVSEASPQAAPVAAAVGDTNGDPVSRRPSAGFSRLVAGIKITGVMQGERVRALVDNRLVYAGDLVDVDLDVRLVDADYGRRLLIFEERGGARLEARY